MKDLETIIRDSGLSVTKPRVEILRVFIDRHGPFSAEEVQNHLPEGQCDQATVFRTLKQFHESEILININLNDNITRYEFNDPTHHHHHVVCKKCGNIDVLEDCLVDTLEENLRNKGYADLDHKLEFFGVCPKCQDN